MAKEIDDVWPDGMLTPEFQVLQLMIPQGLPQQEFCACHAPTQRTRSTNPLP